MKLPPFEYRRVHTVEEAVGLLADADQDVKVLAGGQSLVPLLALRLARPTLVVDINPIAELGVLRHDDGLHIGALVRHRAVERSEMVARRSPLLASAVRFIGHAAIRCRGTIGGSIAHADPAAELPTVLAATDGEVEATSVRGTRTIAAEDFFLGFLATDLAPDELLTAVRFPAWCPSAGWSFQEFSRRSGDFAVVGVAAVLRLAPDSTIAEARLALAGMADTAVRASTAEAFLLGRRASPEVWAEAAALSVDGLEPPADLHGSGNYRCHLAATLVRRALAEAYERTEIPS